jgi:hypothetical protein
MANDWMKLVMKMKKAHPKASLGEAMKMAKKQYKKGGAEEGEVEEPKEMEEVGEVEGARRRKTRRGGNKLSPLPIGGRRKTKKAGRRTRRR